MKPGSQCARVFAVLADGRWHGIAEIHAEAGTMRLNSRVAELRSRGHQIVCERRDEYGYKLVSLSEEAATPVGARTGSPAAVADPGCNKEAAAFSLSDCGQLAWDVAA